MHSDLVIGEAYMAVIHQTADNNRECKRSIIIDPDNRVRAEFFLPSGRLEEI